MKDEKEGKVECKKRKIKVQKYEKGFQIKNNFLNAFDDEWCSESRLQVQVYMNKAEIKFL